MSSYWFTIDGCIEFFKDDERKIYEAIINEGKNDRWNNYGWSKNLRNAENLDEILNIFTIKKYECGSIVQVLAEDTYNSSFLPCMIEVSLPYLLNSFIKLQNSDEMNSLYILEIKDHRRIR